MTAPRPDPTAAPDMLARFPASIPRARTGDAVIASSRPRPAERSASTSCWACWCSPATGTVSLATGVLLGLGTKWGLLRFWWVAVKLALNIVLVVLVGVLLAPAAGSAAAVHAAGGDLGSLAFPPIVSGTALVVATVLAVYKPWGRIGAARRPR